ncbi:MAG: site-2 protease family protein [Deltaproteobacteria bacterium]
MNNRHNPLFWSFAAGTWSGVHLRISWLMPLLLAWLLYKFNLKMGGAFFGILFVSVLLHEIGHILAARATDGSGDEILMWPLGGLAFVETSSPRSQALTAAAGPLTNLLLCGLFLRAVLVSDAPSNAFNPLEIPLSAEHFGTHLLSDVQVLAFWFNWLSLCVNLIPAFPLDGGQILRSWLTARMGAGMGTEVAFRIAIAFAILMGVVDLIFFGNLIVLTLAFMIIVLALQESFQIQATESYDDSFMGYDFSQGYTSLEKSEAARPERRAGLLARWLAKRKADKQRRLQDLELQTEQQLDAILAKVHERGLTSLSPSEKRLLKRASNRYRSKGTEAE